MKCRVREIIIREYSGEKRKDTKTPLYEIDEGTGKCFAYSEKELLKIFGEGLCHGFFNKVHVINEIKDKLKPETLEGLSQIKHVNNNCCREIFKLRNSEEHLHKTVKYHLQNSSVIE